MKFLIKLLFTCFFISPVICQAQQKTAAPDPHKKIQVVDVSCGKCNFNMGGESCKLAVRINGKSYFVDGASLDDYGDAHAKAGMCSMVRKAEVQGEVVDNKFKVTYFKLLPDKKKKELKVVL